MPALGRLEPAEGIAAMQTINAVVMNPWFGLAFFGTAALALVLAGFALFNGGPAAGWLLAGSALYLIGVIVVTIAFNVPLNDALAAVSAESEESATLWTRYLSVWTTWNHVRTIAPLAALACYIMALR